MKIEVVTLFPDMIRAALGYGIPSRAMARGLLGVGTEDPRTYATDVHRTVDDRPYGGGPGMVMKVEPLRSAIRAARGRCPEGSRTILMSAQGAVLDQAKARELAALPGLVLIAGRYEGVDERLIELEVDEELSIGDYVLSGGELPALATIDAVARLLPGALGDAASAEQDSFSEGLLDWPHYTRPEETEGLKVPPVLTGGDHEAIRRWRLKQALGRTWRRRGDLLERLERNGGLNDEQRQLLDEFIAEDKQR